MTPSGSAPAFAGHGTATEQTLRLVGGTRVLTLDGALPVEYLGPGDMIITRNGARPLLGTTAAIHTDVAIVRVAASTLGHGRPGEDVLLPADQPVLLRDWRAQALFGQRQAVVAIARLADGSLIRAEPRAAVRLFTLRFSAPQVIYAEGLEIATAETPADAAV